MQTAVHETGHMLSMYHCTLYKCVMAGSNSLMEADRSPLWLCPECMAKVCWATGADPVQRYTLLAKFCKEQGFEAEYAFYVRSVAVLRPEKPSETDSQVGKSPADRP